MKLQLELDVIEWSLAVIMDEFFLRAGAETALFLWNIVKKNKSGLNQCSESYSSPTLTEIFFLSVIRESFASLRVSE